MGFLRWHYTEGVRFFLRRFWFDLGWAIHYFSFPLLLKTFFSPWKRMLIQEKVGFNLSKLFERLSFNLISRWVGATVRFFLIIGCLLFLLLVFLGGTVAFLIWLLFPPIGLWFFWRQKRQPQQLLLEIIKRVRSSPTLTNKIVFSSQPGMFVLKHLNLKLEDFPSFALRVLPPKGFAPSSFESIIEWLLASSSEVEGFLKQKGLAADDLLWAARWWDRENIVLKKRRGGYGRPGIGWQLLFGYTPNLSQYVTDLSQPQPFARHLIGREEVVSRMERVLSSGSNVMLVGEPGVGKKTTVLEFARRAAEGELGKNLVYARVLEFDYNPILAESTDLNIKKQKLGKLLREAASAGNIILVVNDLYRLTNQEVGGYDFFDVFAPFWERQSLKTVAVSNLTEYERFLAPDTRLKKYFERVEVVPPSKDEALLILMEAALRWEKEKGIVAAVPALRRVIDGSDQFITDIPFPEKALELLDELVFFKEKKGEKVILPADVDQVLSEKTGVSLTALSSTQREKLIDLEKLIHRKLVNQEQAVSLIAQSLRGREAGGKDERRPVGSFLFLGPTGVGKTQTAKVLAEVYFGSEEKILRFDMAEFTKEEGVSRLIGSASRNQPGILTTAIKNNPASLLLLDEIEKAPKEVVNLLLALLDEGMITDAFGKKISCRHLFVIATSNAGAEYIRELVKKRVSGKRLQDMVVEYIQRKGIFSPELLNRFDGVVVYRPLRQEELKKVAYLLLEEFAERLLKQNIQLDFDEELAEKLAKDGYDPAFGARPMRRLLDLTLTDLVSKAILKGEIKNGDRIRILPGKGRGEYLLERG